MTYKQEAEESFDDFVNRCKRMTQRCSLTELEQQQRIIELHYRLNSHCRLPKGVTKKRQHINPGRNY